MATTNLPVVFNFGNQTLRTIDQNGEVWFVASDVCAALDISNPRAAIARLDDDERNTVALNDGIQSGPGNPNTNIINESGLYSLVMSSRKAEAKQFKRWVTHEVLPAIRTTGRYEAPGAQDVGSPADRLVGNPDYYRECRDELFAFVDSMGPGVKWPADEEKRQRIADGYLTDILGSRRWLMSFDYRGQLQTTPVHKDACVINCNDPGQLTTMVGESIPLELLPTVLEVANDRLMRVFKSNIAKYKK